MVLALADFNAVQFARAMQSLMQHEGTLTRVISHVCELCAIVTAFITLPVFFMPVRALIAYLRSPISLRHYKDFLEKQRGNKPRKIRLVLGLYIFGPYLLTLAFFVAISLFPIISIDVRRDIAVIFIIISVIIFPLIVYAVPISYVVEYYLSKRSKIIFNNSYFIVLLYALSFPVSAAGFGGWFILLEPNLNSVQPVKTVTQYEGWDPIFKKIENQKSATPIQLYPAQSFPIVIEEESGGACNQFLDEHDLRLELNAGFEPDIGKTFRNDGLMTKNGGKRAIKIMFMDKFLRVSTLGVSDAFGCSFGNVESNGKYWPFCLYILLYQFLLSSFAISIIVLPIKKIYDKYIVHRREN